MVKKSKSLSNKLIIFLLIFFIFIFIFILARPYYLFIKKITNESPFFLLINKKYKQTGGKTNFLILGIAGGNHEGSNLTDSINFLSLDIKNKKITLIGIPRDIWSETLKDKINSAYAYGEAKKQGGGFLLAKAEVAAILGKPIHYAALIDFEEFKTLIDYLGGIDIYIERSFTDPKYPIKGRENDLCNGDQEYKCRYETLTFSKGFQHMDGDLALKFVRSRYAQGEEGSDFARNKRQQKVLMALYEKILAKVKTLNIKQIEDLYFLLDKAIKRDITNKEILSLGKKFLFLKNIKINHNVLSEDFFIVPPVSSYGKYVLIPKDNDFSLIHQYVDCLLNNNPSSSCNNYLPKKS